MLADWGHLSCLWSLVNLSLDPYFCPTFPEDENSPLQFQNLFTLIWTAGGIYDYRDLEEPKWSEINKNLNSANLHKHLEIISC